MTNTALDLSDSPTLLSALLDEQFSTDGLAELVGPDEPSVPWEVWESALYGPLATLLRRPGKEFRARLVEAGHRLGGGRGEAPGELLAIVEALHAGSLVIDDIEDGSAYRRGAPALHVTIGMPKALNVGSWLYFWPYQLLERLALHPNTELALRRAISRTQLRAHQGQALDLSARAAELPQRELPAVVRVITSLKTGALMQLGAQLGVIAAGGRAEQIAAVARFGRELGVGLQMADDWGGLASESRCHKGHEDLLHSRATWPWAWLAESADELSYAKLAHLAREVARRDTHPEVLAERLREKLGDTPRERIRRQLRGALDDLARVAPKSAVLSELKRAIDALEVSYG